MESGDKGEAEVLRAVAGLRTHEKTAKHIRVASFTTVNKGLAKGFEAADCVAWHWNKYYMDSERAGASRLPHKDFRFLAESAKKQVPMHICNWGWLEISLLTAHNRIGEII